MSKSKLKGIIAIVTLLAVSALSACGSNQDTGPVVAAAIAITSPGGAIQIDGTMQFVATVTDANGNTITATPTWTVVNGGGTITTGGVFTAGDSVGTFTNTIVATIGTVTSASSVTVSAGALSSITVSPDTITLPVGGTHQYTAIGHDAHGHVVAIPARVWSAAASAGTIDTSGMFTASTATGTTASAVTATSGSISGTAQVIVSPGALATITVAPDVSTLDVGATQQFAAAGKDAYGNVVVIAPTWQAATGSVTSTGLYTAGNIPGTYSNSVTATVGLVSGSATIVVNPGPLTSIVISPANVAIFPGSGLQQLTATGHDAVGNIVPITPVWSIDPSQTAAGTITSSGIFTGGTPGNYPGAIIATSGSVVGTSSVQIFSNPFTPCIPTCIPISIP